MVEKRIKKAKKKLKKLRCKAKTSNGKRCKFSALSGEDFCHRHFWRPVKKKYPKTKNKIKGEMKAVAGQSRNKAEEPAALELRTGTLKMTGVFLGKTQPGVATIEPESVLLMDCKLRDIFELAKRIEDMCYAHPVGSYSETFKTPIEIRPPGRVK